MHEMKQRGRGRRSWLGYIGPYSCTGHGLSPIGAAEERHLYNNERVVTARLTGRRETQDRKGDKDSQSREGKYKSDETRGHRRTTGQRKDHSTRQSGDG